MDKQEFLAALKSRLASLPPCEIEKSLDYYSEMIDDRMEDGLSETEAVASLENLDAIAEQIAYGTPISVLIKARAHKQGEQRRGKADAAGGGTGRKVWLITLLALGSPVWLPLLLACLTIILALYVIIWAIIIVLFAVVLSLAAGGVGGIILAMPVFAVNGLAGLVFLGGGLICLALAVFSFFPALYAGKYLIRLTGTIGRKIKSWFIRKGAA